MIGILKYMDLFSVMHISHYLHERTFRDKIRNVHKVAVWLAALALDLMLRAS
jgi:hypothetical protein